MQAERQEKTCAERIREHLTSRLQDFRDFDDGEINRIVYHFNDWFDHAERTLEGSEFDAAERFVTALIPEL